MGRELTLSLFRLTVHPSRTEPLLGTRLAALRTKPEIIRQAALERPSAAGRSGTVWHIGNVQELSPSAIYFRLGRLTRRPFPLADATGDFVDEEFDVAPYTHVFVSADIEVCAIARKAELTPKVDALGRALARVLTKSEIAITHYVEFECAPIKDPTDFLAQLASSVEASRFWLVTRRPNPFDVEEDFAKPTAKVIESLKAQEARTEWKGDHLAVQDEHVADMVRSAASTGGDAGATIRPKTGASAVKIRLTGKQAELVIDSDQVVESISGVVDSLKKLYNRVRGPK